MIAKQKRVKTFGRPLGYDLRKLGAYVGDSNMLGARIGVVPAEMLAPMIKIAVAEFKLLDRMGPILSRPVCHTSLSAAVGEVLSVAEWRTVARIYMRGMGFSDCQRIAVRHPVHDPIRNKKKDPKGTWTTFTLPRISRRVVGRSSATPTTTCAANGFGDGSKRSLD